ncbi:MAG: GAF domain-containing protein [Flavobacteriales bacterium]|nr:GAF domain-containing protein [Flavobacteriales bacterium]
MAEELLITNNLTKEEKYKELYPQIFALIQGEDDLIASLANIMSALKYGFEWLWVGVYFVKGNELVLGPFQGPIACTRIQLGRGVSGTAWHKNEIIIVPDVNEFPDHIICNAASKSEIVLPILNKDGNVALILDVDSDKLNDFDEVDEKYLSKIVQIIEPLL